MSARRSLLGASTADRAQIRAEVKRAMDATHDPSRAIGMADLDRALATQRAALDRANAESLRALTEAQKKGLFGTTNAPAFQWKGGTTLKPLATLSGAQNRRFVKPGSSIRLDAFPFTVEPKVEVGGGKVSIDAKDAAFASLLRALARKARLSVVIGRGFYTDVSLVVSDRSPADTLAILCRAAGAQLRNEGGVYYVTPRSATPRDLGASGFGR